MKSLTIRRACEATFTPAAYSASHLENVKKMCSAWERVTNNPPWEQITPAVVDRFEDALEEIGMQPSTINTYRHVLQSLLNKMHGETFISKRRRKVPEAAPTEIDGTLLSYYHCLYKRYRMAGKSKQAIDNHLINLRHFDRALGRPATLDDLTDDCLMDGMNWLLDKGRLPATVNKFKVSICALWNFLAKRGVVKSWPTVQLLKCPERIPRAWTEAQLFTLFKALGAQKKPVCGLPASDWWIALHLFLWNTAERLTAALMLKVSDVDLDSGYVVVRAETRKYQKRDKSHRLDAETIIRMRRLVAADPNRELMFPTGFHICTLWNRYRAVLRKAGLPHGSKDMFHKMRRSSISHFEAAGGNGTKLADHSNSAVTRKSYIDPTICVEQQAADLLFNPLRKNGGAV